MYWRRFNQFNLELLREASKIPSRFLRFGYPVAPRHPKVKSAGKTDKYLKKLEQWKQIAHEAQFCDQLVNYKLSKDNFIVDEDGNTILDLSMQGGLLALGYNPDALINARTSRRFDGYLAQTPNLAEYPPAGFPDLVRSALLPVAPAGLSDVHLTDGIGGLANEAAIKTALLKYKETHGGLAELNWEDFAANDLSNSSDLLQNNVCVLGLQNSMHGKPLGATSASGAKMVRSALSTFDWPTAPIPNTKYPYHDHSEENKIEENRCISEFERIISERQEANCPVGAIIVEPITFLNHTMATPHYYRQLRKIAKEQGIPFIVDETRTGVGKTAKMWAHEHWHLDDAPDFVTFGGSACVSGYFTTPDFRPLEQHKNTTIGNGSMEKLIAFKHITEHIKRKSLLERVDDTGAYIRAELHRVNKEKRIFTNLRGQGTFIGFDLKDYNATRHLSTHLIRYGILVAMIGPTTIGLRPSLLLEPMHAASLRDALIEYNPNFYFDTLEDNH